jgi:hypothetical protein
MPDFPVHLLIGMLIFVVIYITPTVIAFRRDHPNRWVIAIINIVFGATLLGWLASLVWSLQAVHLSNQSSGSHGGESGLNLFVNDIQQVRIVPEPAGPPQSSFAAGPIDIQTAVLELERLKKLRRDGDLTEEQFEALKVVLLRRV